uniref:Uncharacterized protein n=1 Tax=Amphiprion ocellaris TaxID=80972 RepID=A0A3Q1BSV5_AMPOC
KKKMVGKTGEAGSPFNKQTALALAKRNYVTNLDSSTPAFAHSIGHSSTRRVNHGHEADEAKVLGREVHLIGVKSKALWELIIRQVEVAETWIRREGNACQEFTDSIFCSS